MYAIPTVDISLTFQAVEQVFVNVVWDFLFEEEKKREKKY